jgi:predicted transcriptional regulator of viral defense system
MAEPEKAIVDSLDKIRYAGGIEETVRVVYRGFNKIQRDKLVAFASMMGSHALSQRLGFILSFLDSKKLIDFAPEIKKSLLANVGKAPVYLAPYKPRIGMFSSEWRVVKNLTDKELLSEIEKV